MLLLAQMVPSIPKPLLIAVVCWLVIIFLGFSLLAPPNATSTLALVSAAVSVAVAVFLIMELDHPWGGMIRISSEPMLQRLEHSHRPNEPHRPNRRFVPQRKTLLPVGYFRYSAVELLVALALLLITAPLGPGYAIRRPGRTGSVDAGHGVRGAGHRGPAPDLDRRPAARAPGAGRQSGSTISGRIGCLPSSILSRPRSSCFSWWRNSSALSFAPPRWTRTCSAPDSPATCCWGALDAALRRRCALESCRVHHACGRHDG